MSLEADRREELLNLNDKLFLSAVVVQLLIMGIIFSTAFGLYTWTKNQDVQLKVESNFREWESRITEAVYVNRITQSWKMDKLPVIQDFSNALQINGYPSIVHVEPCHLPSLKDHQEFELRLGELDISECVYVEAQQGHVYAGVFWVVMLTLISFLLTTMLWFFIRSRFKRKLLKPLIDTMERETKDAAIGKMASQIAHDIRSPVAALRILMRDTYSFSEEKRALLQSAVGRIQDIANNLLPNSKKKLTTSTALTLEHLPSLLERLVSEKRIQYRDLLHVDIELDLEEEGYASFVSVKPSELGRAVSNLIDNAVESFEAQEGKVWVRLSSPFKEKVRILIEDNGKGIPSHLLPEITKERVSHGKTSGSGLGLSFVRRFVQENGGKLEISSEVDEGTEIGIVLKKAPEPAWFTPELKLKNSMNVAIIDDDAAIHKIWAGRFKSFRAEERKINLHHFSSLDEIDRYRIKENKDFDLYLVDFEFLGSPENGLNWILKHELKDCARLVTSRYDEKQIKQRCQLTSLKMIPKMLVAFIPFILDDVSPLIHDHFL